MRATAVPRVGQQEFARMAASYNKFGFLM